jgi:pyruvate dehydrogenase E2 component (dihydrolipoamide acetyltransferase)
VQQNALRRKLAIATWDKPREGIICGVKVTVTHFVGRAIALAAREAPGLNGVIRLGRFVPHPWVNVTFLVALEDERGQDLAKVVVEDADQKSIVEIAGELGARARKLHAKQDDEFKKQIALLRYVPAIFVKPILSFIGWLTGVWGVNIPALGLTPYPFGSVIITNVGVFALDEGFAPHTPFAHIPLYVTMGRMREQPVVEDGEVVARKVLTIGATIDHRFMDGAQGAVLAKTVRKYFENPELLGLADMAPESAASPEQGEASESSQQRVMPSSSATG